MKFPFTPSRLKAVKRHVANIFDKMGQYPWVIETWEPLYCGAYDDPRNVELVSDGVTLMAYDDPRPEPIGRYKNRYLDDQDFRGAFFVVVPNLAPVEEFGLCYDDPLTNTTPTDYNNTYGQRAICAYDVGINVDGSSCAVPAGILVGCYDGIDIGKAALFAGLCDTLQQIKAGGIFVTVELENQ